MQPLSRIGRIVALSALSSIAVWGQTTVAAPLSDNSGCEGVDCAAAARAGAVESTGPHTYPYRSWQFDDTATRPTERGKKSEAETANRASRRPGLRSREDLKDEPPTEFQELVYGSTGMRLPVYGESLFRNAPSTFLFKTKMPVPADYVLGMGDHLMIHVWGQVDISARVIVDRNGQIYLPKVGVIGVSGVRFDELAEYLKKQLGRLFRNFDLSVSLGQLRSVQVLVVGRVRRPGSYTLGSLSTLVNALFSSGGPSGNGSLRHVQLKRQGQVIAELDLYDLLLKGDRSHDPVLQSGDMIYVPPAGRRVAVIGSVNQPAIYEMEEGATLKDLIGLAGGLSATADATRATLERIDDHSRRTVEEFPLDEKSGSRPLRDGDLLRVFSVSPRFENAVTLRGNVAHPGRYPWRSGMRIGDLIPSREAIIATDYWVRQNALGQPDRDWIEGAEKGPRKGAHSGDRCPADKCKEEGRSQDQPSSQDGPDGSDDGATTRVERDYGEINWDYAVVQRLDPDDLSTRLLPFDLGRALAEPNSADNLALQAGDVVTVFSQRDLAVPVEKRTKFVWVEGEVRASGVYRALPGETLREIVARAGGLTPQAYLFAADFQRESTRQEQRQKLEGIVQEMERELRSKTAKLAASASPEDGAAGREELEFESGMIEKLKHTAPTGRVVLELKTSDRDASALPPLPLQDGDRIRIPSRPATVAVAGAVYNPNAFIFRADKSISEYIAQSGGATRDADRGRMFVIRADGSVVSKQMHHSLWTGGLESLRLVPGDTIVVPERVRTGSVLRGIRDWSQVFAQFALGAAAIRVISP